MDIIEFKNTNFNLKLDKIEIQNAENFTEVIIEVFNYLNNFDFYVLGDVQSAGNFDSFFTLYNFRLNKCYNFVVGCSMDLLRQGKTLKLYAHDPDCLELDEIAKFYS